MEVFCGSGRLTASVRKLGVVEAIGIDHILSKRLQAPAIKLDLNSQNGREVLKNMMESDSVMWIHFAPPCGTASRARNIRRGPHDPPPARSEEWPDGLPNLSGTLQSRVSLANELYSLTSELSKKAYETGIFTSVENPWRSFMWDTSHWMDAARHVPYFDVCFDRCMYNGLRDKRTRLKHTMPLLQNLENFCDNSHEHSSWGRTSQGWSTAEETAYPWQLCSHMAFWFAKQLEHFGVSSIPRDLEDFVSFQHNQLASIATSSQPRGKKIPPLVAEFKQVLEITVPRDDAPPPRIKTPWKIPARAVKPDGIDTLPAGCRVLRTLHLPRGEVAASEQLDKNGCDWMKCIAGVPWSIEEFIEKARKCLHPKLLTSGLPPELDQVINKNASLCGKSLSMERTATMRKWLGWALECMEAEDKLKNEMSAPRRSGCRSASRSGCGRWRRCATRTARRSTA